MINVPTLLVVQVNLNNQVIEDLLMEAIIMRKFNNPNVLNIFGVSVYEQKPCILLPLMHNGDLKKYLEANTHVSRTNLYQRQNLTKDEEKVVCKEPYYYIFLAEFNS